MLGMMNAPADGVEFYSTNRNSEVELSDADRKTFTEVKAKAKITYTDDGRKLTNGQPIDLDVQHLWQQALLRTTVTQTVQRKVSQVPGTPSESDSMDAISQCDTISQCDSESSVTVIKVNDEEEKRRERKVSTMSTMSSRKREEQKIVPMEAVVLASAAVFRPAKRAEKK